MESEEIARLKAIVQEQEEKLQVAAKFGRDLLTKNEKLEETLHGLEAERDRDRSRAEEREEENSYLRKRLEDMERQIEDGSAGLSADLSRRLVEAERQHKVQEAKIEKLSDENADLKERCQVLSSQLKDAETLTAMIGSENEKMKAERDQTQGNYLEFSKLQADHEKLLDTYMNCKTVHEKLQKEYAVVQRKASSDHIELEKLREAMDAMKLERGELQRKLEGSSATQSEDQEKRATEIKQLKQEKEETLIQLESVEWDRKQLRNQYLVLVKENQKLYKEQEEHQEFLDEARNTVNTLRRALEENQASNGSSPSLLGELEAGLNKRIEAEKEKKKEQEIDGKSPANEMKDCEVEYFFLAVTAVRISMATQYPHQSDPLNQISAKTLFDLCNKSHVPFHQWHEWLHREMYARLKWGPKIPPKGPAGPRAKPRDRGNAPQQQRQEASEPESSLKDLFGAFGKQLQGVGGTSEGNGQQKRGW
eukprot:CAMPEP_0119127210 /NCGR_PEP_ID=MMETSP1310-20130426/5848_1 /TAXON_ID=464262 /ORGANISM="Genus nov. species nov., Strain RCC2339" /LENGTH=478 /DNA_ID=CAMNT_0007117449 /DNA_START=162 /DNA_END=1595 /DNA_ORIENTATION=+